MKNFIKIILALGVIVVIILAIMANYVLSQYQRKEVNLSDTPMQILCKTAKYQFLPVRVLVSCVKISLENGAVLIK